MMWTYGRPKWRDSIIFKKDAGWLHLDRDDQGVINDKISINGEEYTYPINRGRNS